MSCAVVRRRLEASVDGGLAPELQAALRAHLAGCAGCSAQHRAAVTLPGRLAALPAPAGPDLVPAVMSRIRRRRRHRHVSAGLLAAEAMLACLALVQFGLSGLLAAAAGSLSDGSALLGGSTPAPAPGDLGLVLTLLLLVAVCAVHVGLLGATPPRRSRG